MLCWPVSSFNQTVAIPCKDSKQFEAIIKQSRPSIEVTHIPGNFYLNSGKYMKNRHKKQSIITYISNGSFFFLHNDIIAH